jgi:hypothetical protein
MRETILQQTSGLGFQPRETAFDRIELSANRLVFTGMARDRAESEGYVSIHLVEALALPRQHELYIRHVGLEPNDV